LQIILNRSGKGEKGSVIFYCIFDENEKKEEMARQVRIEFAGAMYHVMARGDREEAIAGADEDRRKFLQTLGEACKRVSGCMHTF